VVGRVGLTLSQCVEWMWGEGKGDLGKTKQKSSSIHAECYDVYTSLLKLR